MKLDLTKVLIGTDFELLVKDTEGKFRSAIPFIEGTKSEPQTVGAEGFMIQHDGVLAEGNVPPVGIKSGEEMWENLQFILEQMQIRLPNGLKLECCTSADFQDDELEHPEARVAGCTADYNAWNEGAINIPPNFRKTNARCCGHHWHISAPGLSAREAMRLIRILDVTLALPLLFEDDDRQRRKLYGKAGTFRLKDFGNALGVEYRVLSNVCLKNKDIFDFTWSGIRSALNKFNEGVDYLAYKERIEEAINNYNFQEAEILCEELKVERILQLA